MGDSKQLFLSVFCLVLPRDTKEQGFYRHKCQRMAMNGFEPCDLEQMLSRVRPGVSHKRPRLLVSIYECGDHGAPPGHSGTRLWEALGVACRVLGPRTSQIPCAHTSPSLAQILPTAALCWFLETCNCPGKGNFSFLLAFKSLAKLG